MDVAYLTFDDPEGVADEIHFASPAEETVTALALDGDRRQRLRAGPRRRQRDVAANLGGLGAHGDRNGRRR